MQVRKKNKPLSAGQEKAALLIATKELSDQQIGDEIGVDACTVWRWRKLPRFQARIDEHLEDFCRAIRSRGIAIRERRIAELQERHERMKRVIAERAEDPKMQGVPGGETGLLVHNVKSVGAGVQAERVDLYEVDTGLLKELREHEKQAAQELGEWTEKRELSGDLQFHPMTFDGDKQATADDDSK